MKKFIALVTFSILAFAGTGYAAKHKKTKKHLLLAQGPKTNNALDTVEKPQSTPNMDLKETATPMEDVVPTQTVPPMEEIEELIIEIPEPPIAEPLPEPIEKPQASSDFMANIMNQLDNIEQRLVSIENLLNKYFSPGQAPIEGDDIMEDVSPPIEDGADMVDLDDSEQQDVVNAAEIDLNEII